MGIVEKNFKFTMNVNRQKYLVLSVLILKFKVVGESTFGVLDKV